MSSAKTSAWTSAEEQLQAEEDAGTKKASGSTKAAAVVSASMVAISTSPAKTLPKSRIERLTRRLSSLMRWIGNMSGAM